MGNKKSICDRYSSDAEFQKQKAKFSSYELAILERIFMDLSARNGDAINKETFLQFFPLTGLWGERLFDKFDLRHEGKIDFAEFIWVLSFCCKCSKNEKVKILFDLYDSDHDGFLEKRDVLCMLYNYPKSHLRNITEDTSVAPDRGKKMLNFKKLEKIQSMTQLKDPKNMNLSPSNFKLNIQQGVSDTAYNKPQKKLAIASLNDIRESEDEEEKRDSPEAQKKSISHPNSMDEEIADENPNPEVVLLTELQRDILDPVSHRDIRIKLSPAFSNKKFPSKFDLFIATDSPANRASVRKGSAQVSSTTTQNAKQKAPVQNKQLDLRPITLPPVATNVNNRIKLYANSLFASACSRTKVTGKLSLIDFEKWIETHPAMLRFFNESFRQDLWEAEPNHQNQQVYSSLRTVSTSSENLPETYNSITPDKKKAMSLISETSSGKIPDLTVDPRAKIPLRCFQIPAEFSGHLKRFTSKPKSWKKQFFELRGHFLFYYNKNTKSKLPDGIIFLDGCYIDVKVDEFSINRYGFTISHKNPSYANHHLYCYSKNELDSWMDHLMEFQKSSIQDFYDNNMKIGSGKFSVVFKGKSKKDKNDYAIKVITKDKLSAEERDFLLDETSIFKVLDHKNIIKHIETIENKSFIYIITELVSDGDLFDYVLRNQFLEEFEANIIMKQLLECINYLHDTGVIHRDLKPENILIVQDPNTKLVKEVKLIDFGFAKFVTKEHKLFETCGTPNYAAPEIFKARGYDQRTDLWSIGIIMHFLLQGTLPFDANELDTIIERTVIEDLFLEGEFWDNVSEEAKDLLLKLLEKNPDDRITVKDALEHPWFKKSKDELAKSSGANSKAKNDPWRKKASPESPTKLPRKLFH